jgi:hypothetical protein
MKMDDMPWIENVNSKESPNKRALNKKAIVMKEKTLKCEK